MLRMNVMKMMKTFMTKIKQMWAVFTVGLHKVFTYRLKLFAWVLSGVTEPLIWGVLWFAAAETGEIGLNRAEIFTYYAFIALVSRLTWTWTFDDVRNEIFEGRYSKYLLWPSGLTGYRFGLDLSNKILTLLALLPFWIVFIMYGDGLGLLDISWRALPIAIGALVIAILLRFLIDMVLGHAALWLGKTEGLSLTYHAASRVLGGVSVPLIFLPDLAGELAFLLPFRYVYSFPVEILIGSSSGGEVLWGFTVAIFWIFCSLFAMSAMFRYGLKRYEAVGI